MSVRIGNVGLCAIALVACAAPAIASDPQRTVSVLTYNVHGLPWPVAEDRSVSLSAIAAQFRAMRAAHRQPDIVALQEAFVPDAKAIGIAAGYRYIAFGAPAEAAADATTANDRRFVAEGSMFRGERVGKHVGSGLAIFSDYPILAVRRVSYPVCAGYDCLANKGAMAALIAIPGVARPVTVINTHLNSNGATGVSQPRALYAYRRQIDLLSSFIGSVARPETSILVAGDFNVGKDIARRRYFAEHMFGGPVALTGGSLQCRMSRACLVSQPADIAISTGRAKDWLMYHASNALSIRPLGLSAPFGRDAANAMLSDHIGVMLTYALGNVGIRAKPLLALAAR
ncbi:endonuclease/exonuclease/phosphatase family protein [Sphingomonas sp. R86521]|uniref:endonuclease/exonuclease/phosphatase family protein n=1 Tax=Sphingomonas sp. R86521 TaxID=3093860 RepID=UPI0036D23D54